MFGLAAGELRVLFGVVLALLVLLGSLVERAPLAAERPVVRLGRGAALLAACLLIAVGRPPVGPFALGLLGGGLAMLAAVIFDRPAASAALAAVAGLMLALHDYAVALPAASGVAFGAWLVGWSVELPERADRGRPFAAAALLSTTAVATAFGASRSAALAPFVAPYLALAAAVALAGLSPFRGRLAAALPLLVMALIAALSLAVCRFAHLREALWPAPLFGLAAAGLLRALRPAEGELALRLRDGVVAALILVGTGALAFAVGRGLGLALAGLAFAAMGCLPGDDEPPLAWRCGAAALCGWVMIRLFYEQAARAGAADLYLDPVLVALLLGLVGPLLAGPLAVRVDRGVAELGLLAASALAVAAPALLAVLLWRERAVSGVVAAGLVGPICLLALAPLLSELPARSRTWLDRLPAAYALLAVTAPPVAESMARLGQWSRAAKLIALAILLLLLAPYLVVRPGRAPADGGVT